MAMRRSVGLLSLLICCAAVPLCAAEPPPRKIDFNRDIRPILSDTCFACHGPDGESRETELRFDHKESAFGELSDGSFAIVPGQSAESQLIERITSDDDALRMPPEDSNKKLTAEQIELLKQWIDDGAAWDEHWALVPPQRSQPPTMTSPNLPRNAIDQFILARLDAEGLSPSPQADRVTLIRRLSFDLIGLPPTVAEVEAFVGDQRPDAYERLVERLLASPHFGERLAVYWLDLVRYADTVGYHGDQTRSVSAYRDYVIDAFNANRPYDQFTIEQLAGDLLPNASREQKVAAGYNMLGMTTIEGGAQAKEYLAKYAADRVRTTSVVWMGATLGCAECHDHKFDPYTARDFYSFASFFADIQQKGVANPAANLLLPTEKQQQQLTELETQLAAAQATYNELEAEHKKVAENQPAGNASTPETESGEEPAVDEELKQRLNAAKGELANAKRLHKRLLSTIRKTISPVSGDPREMRVLARGDWMDEAGEVVQPAIPAALGALPPMERRATRLDLAQWLVSREQPQTARVFVNRLWKLYFGRGLSSVLDDLGSQGERPSHPELLDWLAVEFMESGWDIKHMIRLIVTSSTYRQSSLDNNELRTRDAQNRLLARQSRFRIEAEFVRDTALEISGLLVKDIGGEPVRPYQPAGYYGYLNFPKRTYQPHNSDLQYRRGVYMHWQRTFLHPMLLAFDGPSREECTAERPISNTPLAALTLLNDPSFVEASRAFAERILNEGGTTDDEQLSWAWRQAVSRTPDDRELELLRKLLDKHRQSFANDHEAAEKLMGVGLHTTPPDSDLIELAAWTSVARTIINLNETITRN
ncbi:Planctomycete cytochrome C [Symmachiella dynata]|uniref:PSD1 and planctomycete cytochrome C domain-containing protein n=1 Tax=Symmachiella dynata TaxID=2527995 RepID=UPI001187E82E|nr:PSD1 and planctomycete cytochrome C domain-containing protein [Symmachiella dynata]QDT47866.1 Planctomycete cytochrome C [Symmachiella dynata]